MGLLHHPTHELGQHICWWVGQEINCLDLECAPKAHVLKGWSSAWHYWKVEEPLRGRTQWKVLDHWGHALEGDCGMSVSSSFLLPGSHEVSSLLSYMLLPRNSASAHV
jgi:hypothetical protein